MFLVYLIFTILLPLFSCQEFVIDYDDVSDEFRSASPEDDFPLYASVPDTSFRCEDQSWPGYYSDPETSCQVFHICVSRHNRLEQYSFLCPNYTVFHQELLVCVWRDSFECQTAPLFYFINEDIFDDDFSEENGIERGVGFLPEDREISNELTGRELEDSLDGFSSLAISSGGAGKALDVGDPISNAINEAEKPATIWTTKAPGRVSTRNKNVPNSIAVNDVPADNLGGKSSGPSAPQNGRAVTGVPLQSLTSITTEKSRTKATTASVAEVTWVTTTPSTTPQPRFKIKDGKVSSKVNINTTPRPISSTTVQHPTPRQGNDRAIDILNEHLIKQLLQSTDVGDGETNAARLNQNSGKSLASSNRDSALKNKLSDKQSANPKSSQRNVLAQTSKKQDLPIIPILIINQEILSNGSKVVIPLKDDQFPLNSTDRGTSKDNKFNEHVGLFDRSQVKPILNKDGNPEPIIIGDQMFSDISQMQLLNCVYHSGTHNPPDCDIVSPTLEMIKSLGLEKFLQDGGLESFKPIPRNNANNNRGRTLQEQTVVSNTVRRRSSKNEEFYSGDIQSSYGTYKRHSAEDNSESSLNSGNHVYQSSGKRQYGSNNPVERKSVFRGNVKFSKPSYKNSHTRPSARKPINTYSVRPSTGSNNPILIVESAEAESNEFNQEKVFINTIRTPEEPWEEGLISIKSQGRTVNVPVQNPNIPRLSASPQGQTSSNGNLSGRPSSSGTYSSPNRSNGSNNSNPTRVLFVLKRDNTNSDKQ